MALWLARPNAVADYDEWTLSVGANKVAAVDPLDPISHDDASSYISTVTPDQLRQSFFPGTRPAMAAVNSVTVKHRSRANGGVQTFRLFSRLRGVNSADADVSADNGVWGTQSVALPRPGGGVWSVGDIMDSTFSFAVRLNNVWVATSLNVTSLWVEVDYNPSPAQIGQAREVGSREVRYFRTAPWLLTWTGPLELLDTDLVDAIEVSHPDAPTSDGLGWRTSSWQRRRFEILEMTVNPMANTVTVVARDLRYYRMTFWDTARAYGSAGPLANGVARWDPGCTRSYTRAGRAYVQNPGNSGATWVELLDDQEKLDYYGEMLEQSVTNEVVESSFRNGTGAAFAGWTAAGTGVNSSAITEETSDLAFDSAVSARHPKFLSGNPHSTDLEETNTTSRSISANVVCAVSIIHKETGTAATSWAVQRGVDSKWFRASDRTWQVAKTWNALTIRASWTRDVFHRIDVGAGATTLTLRVGIASGAAAAQVCHVHHAQLGQAPFATSVVVTDAAIVAGNSDVLGVSNNSAARCWPNTAGRLRVKVIPHWDAADVSAVNKTLLYIEHDANNFVWIYYNGPAGAFRFQRRAGGTDTTASYVVSVTRGTQYELVARWTSTAGELGLASRTQQLFVNKVKGTDAAAAADPTEIATVTMQLGRANAGEYLDGYVSEWDIVPDVSTDVEVARL